MAGLDNDTTIFPPEWGWEKYAPAMREMAAQIARHSTAVDRLSPLEQEVNSRLIGLWWNTAIDEGRLPSYNERMKHEDEYLEILDSLVADAKAKLAQGRLATGVESLVLYPRLMKEYEESLANEKGQEGPQRASTPRGKLWPGWFRWRGQTGLSEYPRPSRKPKIRRQRRRKRDRDLDRER